MVAPAVRLAALGGSTIAGDFRGGPTTVLEPSVQDEDDARETLERPVHMPVERPGVPCNDEEHVAAR